MKIKYQDNVRLILYLKSIRVTSDHIGVNLKVSQIQRLEPLSLYTSLFQINENNSAQNLKPPPIPPPMPPPIANKKGFCVLKDKNAKNSLLLNQNENSLTQISEQNAVQTRPSLSDIIASKNKLRKTNILC